MAAKKGRKKIQSITRYTTVGIAILQAVGYYFMMRNYNLLASDATGIWPALVIVLSFIAGSSFVMWMGEQVTEFGIGNGISIILFAGILSRIPTPVRLSVQRRGELGQRRRCCSGRCPAPGSGGVAAGGRPGADCVRRVHQRRGAPHSRAVCQAQVGRKMYGGQSSTLPMKVNMSGVLPIIFAQSIASLPMTIWTFIGIPEEEDGFPVPSTTPSIPSPSSI